MNEEKLSSDAVPRKFAEWLLSMGCPAEKVPSIEKISEMCRGQFYMVWCCLMEHVHPKDLIRCRRLQVFCDDIKKCKGKHTFHERAKNTVVPPELEQWRLQTEVTQKVESAKARVTLARQELNQLIDKVSNKLTQRNQSLRRAADAQRRALFLEQVAEELQAKRDNLDETKAIADSLCGTEEDVDLQNKLDKCIASLKRQNSQPGFSNSSLMSNPVASSSILSNGDSEIEEQLISSVVKQGGAKLCSALYSRHAQLVRALSIPNVAVQNGSKTHTEESRPNPQWVLTHTAALHCNLALEATKNKTHLKNVQKQLVATLDHLNNYLTGESCELLVTRCEKTYAEARVEALRSLLDGLTTRSGVFHARGAEVKGGGKSVHQVDKAIETKKEELTRVLAAISEIESMTDVTRDCLSAVFGQFCQQTPTLNYTAQTDPPAESICSLREFYSSRRLRQSRHVDVSLELDVSESSYEAGEHNNPKFVDEFNFYLKKFNLEKNRKLVLESGDKIWTFETLASSGHRLQAAWLSSEQSCALLCPSQTLPAHIDRLLDAMRYREQLQHMLCGELDAVKDIDITPYIETEASLNDKTKKRLHGCIQDLQKTQKTIDTGKKNIQIWSDNNLRHYISASRVILGQTYKDYERYYVENCLDVI